MNEEISKNLKELKGKGTRTSDILKCLIKNNIEEFYELQKWSKEDIDEEVVMEVKKLKK